MLLLFLSMGFFDQWALMSVNFGLLGSVKTT